MRHQMEVAYNSLSRVYFVGIFYCPKFAPHNFKNFHSTALPSLNPIATDTCLEAKACRRMSG